MSDNNQKKIRVYNIPHQKGHLKDYWVAICEGDIEDAETKEEAIKKIQNKRKDLH